MSNNRVGIPVKEPARKKIAFTKQGEKNWNTKLTADQVLKIRSLENKMPISTIAKDFKISYIHARNTILRKAWKHI